MKTAILLFFLLMSSHTLTGQDYIVTRFGKIMTGHVTRHHPVSGKGHLLIRNRPKEQEIPYAEVHEFSTKERKYLLSHSSDKSGNRSYDIWEVAVDGGDIHFLSHDLLYGDFGIYHNGVFYRNWSEQFDERVWPKLMQCPTLAKRYTRHAINRRKGKALVAFDRHERIWKEMISQYSAHCTAPPKFRFEIGFRERHFPDFPYSITYTLSNGYLVREISTYDRQRPHRVQVKRDSVTFSEEQHRPLKARCLPIAEAYYGAEGCAHEHGELKLRAGYSPCRANGLPGQFVHLQQFLEDLFEPPKRTPLSPTVTDIN